MGPQAFRKKLVETDHRFRIRTNDFRIIYDSTDAVVSVTVIRVVHREDAYKVEP